MRDAGAGRRSGFSLTTCFNGVRVRLKPDLLTDAAVGVEVLADVLFESGDDFVEDFLRTSQLVFERNDTRFERPGLFGGL